MLHKNGNYVMKYGTKVINEVRFSDSSTMQMCPYLSSKLLRQHDYVSTKNIPLKKDKLENDYKYNEIISKSKGEYEYLRVHFQNKLMAVVNEVLTNFVFQKIFIFLQSFLK